MINEARRFEHLLGLEQVFTVVYWDQRGCGRSLGDQPTWPTLAWTGWWTTRCRSSICFDTGSVERPMSAGSLSEGRWEPTPLHKAPTLLRRW